ncbi:MAG: GNAT family N-acetyltransferase [Firmicutes bacterium]|nr:GNAT family N-acetyltransferase [Bacillota bacterium]
MCMDNARYAKPVLAGIQKVLQRGTAQVLEEDAHGIFLRDTVSGAWMAAADSTETGIRYLTAQESSGYSLLCICGNRELTDYAANRYGLTSRLDCYQAVYPAAEPPDFPQNLTIQPADMGDLDWITARYDLLTPGEIAEIIRRRRLFVGQKDGSPVGFVGEHLEGSMGLLQVLPEYRGCGYGTELETFLLRRTLGEGFQPFCQVETGNSVSLKLQRKLGLEISREHVYWLSR